MIAAPVTRDVDDLLARLADAAYQVVLNKGLREPFDDVELEIWHRLKGAYREEADAT